MIRTAQAFLALLALLLGISLSADGRAQDRFEGFSQAELDQMLAPIALFPDTLLSHVLIAATYPIEVVQAARWTRNNPGLRGEQAVNAVVGQDWDPSVMALVAFPDLLARMDADLDWTQRLGDAFLVQEHEVLDSIQRLRAQAHHSGHLRSTEQVQVIREREVIYIEPARREVVFVPVYDTRVVFGSWAWVHHPPVFWHWPSWHRSSVVVFWGPAFHVPPAFFFSSFHWSRRHVVVVHHHHHFFHPHRRHAHRVVHHHHHHHHHRARELARHDSARPWQHDPVHRRGVAYRANVDDRHRQLQAPAVRHGTATEVSRVRVADARSDQRQWAERRRAEPILAQSGSAAARTSPASSAAQRSTVRPASAPVPDSRSRTTGVGSAVVPAPARTSPVERAPGVRTAAGDSRQARIESGLASRAVAPAGNAAQSRTIAQAGSMPSRASSPVSREAEARRASPAMTPRADVARPQAPVQAAPRTVAPTRQAEVPRPVTGNRAEASTPRPPAAPVYRAPESPAPSTAPAATAPRAGAQPPTRSQAPSREVSRSPAQFNSRPAASPERRSSRRSE